MKIGSGIGIGVTAIVGLGLLFTLGGSFYTIDQGEEGVILRNGAYVETVGPGFHTKTPFIDSVVEHSLRQQTVTFENMEAYSNDQQPAHIRISVTFQPLTGSGENIYEQFGGTDGFVSRVLSPRVPAVFKNVFGQFKAETAIRERARLNIEALEAIKESIKELASDVNIISVQIEDIAFSQAYIASIEAKQLATVEVQKREQELAQKKIEAQITVTQAQAEADSRLAIATAEALAIKLKGEAEAEAIDARGKALRENPNVVALVTAENWNGVLPTTMLPNGTVPFLNVDPNTVSATRE
jgi:regulator of protease activity HflC (stomatin/prohibitin superfamily)